MDIFSSSIFRVSLLFSWYDLVAPAMKSAIWMHLFCSEVDLISMCSGKALETFRVWKWRITWRGSARSIQTSPKTKRARWSKPMLRWEQFSSPWGWRRKSSSMPWRRLRLLSGDGRRRRDTSGGNGRWITPSDSRRSMVKNRMLANRNDRLLP